MKKRTGILGVLIAILVLGIGYAAVSAIPLTISGTGTVESNPEAFKVQFMEVASMEGDGTKQATIDSSDPTKASISVTGLNQSGAMASFTYTVQNISDENINAELQTPTVTNSNPDYFVVDAVVNNPTTLAVNDQTSITVNVLAIKTPIGDDETTNIEVTVNANPVEP